MIVTVFVVAQNSDNATQLLVYEVEVDAQQFDNDIHLALAELKAEEGGFEPSASFTSKSPAGRALAGEALIYGDREARYLDKVIETADSHVPGW